jgi:hypothetical protein
LSSLLTLLFAPSFLLLIRFFDFSATVIVYMLLSAVLLVYAVYRGKKAGEKGVLALYFLLLTIALFMDSYVAIKLIPVFMASGFALFFLYGTVTKRGVILGFTELFYRKALSEDERFFLKRGDLFWAVAIALYAFWLLTLALWMDEWLWAFFSSVGWYFYFIVVLGIQIVYVRIRIQAGAPKRHT